MSPSSRGDDWAIDVSTCLGKLSSCSVAERARRRRLATCALAPAIRRGGEINSRQSAGRANIREGPLVGERRQISLGRRRIAASRQWRGVMTE